MASGFAIGARRVAIPLAVAAFLLIALEALVAVPAAAISKVGLLSGVSAFLVGGVISAIALVAAVWALERLPPSLVRLFSAPAGPGQSAWLAPVLVGLVLRVLLILIADVSPMSDAKVYTTLAETLARGEPYYFAHSWAYWPVGYPFLLSVWFRVFGSSLAAIHLFNLLIYSVTMLGLWSVCCTTCTRRVSQVALWILALWPDLISLSAWPSKELVAMALLVIVAALLVSAGRSKTARHLAAGGLGGTLVLVQPSFILLVPVIPLLGFLVRGPSVRKFAAEWAVFMLAAIAVVSPWTYRNYTVLGAFVPVATNGGEVLYRANNPLATGEYVKRGQVDLWDLPELEANAKGLELAKAWITENPRAFFNLAIRKQVFFLEDDAIGVYEVFRRGRAGEPVSAGTYLVLKAICSVFWWSLWLALAAALIRAWRRGVLIEDLLPLTVCLPVFYLYAIHSIVESGPRYHQPSDPFLAVAVACVLGVAVLGRQQAHSGVGTT